MTDYAVIRSDETLGVYDNLADAVRIWKPLRAKGARIISMSLNSYVWSAIVGDVTVRPRGKPTARRRSSRFPWAGTVSSRPTEARAGFV